MKLLASVISGVVLGVTGVLGVAYSPLAAAADAPHKAAVATPPPAPVSTFALEPDGVSFGMNAEGVARLYDAWWDKQFVPKYRKANPGPKTRELDYELAEKKKVLRRVTTFDGRSSFDNSDFNEEFAHGNGESMSSAKLFRRLSTPAAASPAAPPPVMTAVAPPASGSAAGAASAKAVSYTRRLFFFQDRLWKIYDEYLLEPQGPLGADFKEATARVEASLGAGTKRTRGPESKWENVVFENGPNRVRVVKLPSNHVAVVRSDNALAREVLDKRSHQVQARDEKLDADIQAVIR